MEQLLMADEEQVLSSEEDKYVGKDKCISINIVNDLGSVMLHARQTPTHPPHCMTLTTSGMSGT